MGVGWKCVDNEDIRIIIGKCGGVEQRHSEGVIARSPLRPVAGSFPVE